jgi:SAM-dependent methyltransferase
MKTIQEILESHETDKHNDDEHSYGDVYAAIFGDFDRMAELNILELGVQRGGSLYAWQEFFPNAHIYGVDITDTRLDKYKKDPKIIFYKEDLKDAVKHFEGMTFDIIIDDSDHFDGTMAWIVKNYWKFLKPKGVMIIEDIQIPERYTETIMASMPPGSAMEHFDMRYVKNRPDDYIITLTND